MLSQNKKSPVLCENNKIPFFMDFHLQLKTNWKKKNKRKQKKLKVMLLHVSNIP